MRDAFSGYHPFVNFSYFTAVLLFAMFVRHPVIQGLSLCCAITYSVYLNGRKAIFFNLKFMLPLLIITALVNPAFSHEGLTVLMYFRNGNPLTLESILFGISGAVMLITVISWFACYNSVMTSDKFIYLFGRVIPAMSLLLSMTLRFVPKFQTQMRMVSNAQKCIGRDISNGNLLQRARHGVRILSIMVTWMLENAIDTADSMKSRGYGLKGRTAFSIFRFESRDKMALAAILLAMSYVIFGWIKGGIYFRYYPSIKSADNTSVFTLSIFVAFFFLCALPIVINVWEDRKWKLLQSSV